MRVMNVYAMCYDAQDHALAWHIGEYFSNEDRRNKAWKTTVEVILKNLTRYLW